MKNGSASRTGGVDEEGFEYHPLTPDRWGDLETLFGQAGASSGCWCMWWRQSAAEFEKLHGEQNRVALRGIVDEDHVPGILLYREGQPVGWCSVAPRDEFSRLNRSPLLKPVDAEPVWSIVCFYVARGFRHQGINGKLLQAALAYARDRGAKVVEGYPLDTNGRDYPALSAWTGFLQTFLRAGFTEVLRRKVTRPIVRYRLQAGASDLDAQDQA